jgi:DDE superfamily endonuclease
MANDRNFAGIANNMEAADGQALQHFMSNSPWSGQRVFEHIREEIKEKPELHSGTVLILDEYADEKAGGESAGTLRQYNGRRGKVDMCQVAVALDYVTGSFFRCSPFQAFRVTFCSPSRKVSHWSGGLGGAESLNFGPCLAGAPLFPFG